MRLPWVLYALLLAMCALVFGTYFVVGRPSIGVGADLTYLDHGVAHSTFETMKSGGDGHARHMPILWLGWAFGVCQIMFFMVCLTLGSRKHGRIGPMKWPLIAGGVIYAALFTAMVVSYRRYAVERDLELVLAFPPPTAWMLYGVWLFPLVFVAVYVFYFDRWTMTPDDLDRFRALAAKRTAPGKAR